MFLNETVHGKFECRVEKRIVKSVLWSVVLYASESWSVTQADRKRLEAMEMWIWRRMEEISFVDKVNNNEVLQFILISCTSASRDENGQMDV